MRQYLDLLDLVMNGGVDRPDRTWTGTRAIFAHQLRFDLADGFPLLTTKRIHFKSVVAELLWFLSGSTNVRDLQAMGCTIWDEWARPDGDLGPIYGRQWRSWRVIEEVDPNGHPSYHHSHIDQISEVIASIKRDPFGRRHIVSAWNPADIFNMALPPCHMTFQFFVAEGVLSCHLLMRSADLFLGVPFNAASYALLTHLIARETGLRVGELGITMVDCHLYQNHFEQAREQMRRAPRALPKLIIAPDAGGIFDILPTDIGLEGYDPHPTIKASVAV